MKNHFSGTLSWWLLKIKMRCSKTKVIFVDLWVDTGRSTRLFFSFLLLNVFILYIVILHMLGVILTHQKGSPDKYTAKNCNCSWRHSHDNARQQRDYSNHDLCDLWCQFKNRLLKILIRCKSLQNRLQWNSVAQDNAEDSIWSIWLTPRASGWPLMKAWLPTIIAGIVTGWTLVTTIMVSPFITGVDMFALLLCSTTLLFWSEAALFMIADHSNLLIYYVDLCAARAFFPVTGWVHIKATFEIV